MKRQAIILAVTILMVGRGALGAQDFSGSMESRLGWYWQSPGLLPLSQIFEGKIDGRVGDRDLPTAQYSARLKVGYDPVTAITALDLGETWIKLFAGPLDISLGNQVVAWSNTDAFWPSDVVNPLDLGLPIDPVKMPVPLCRLVYNGSFFTVDLVAQPFWVAPALPAEPWVAAPPLPMSFEAIGMTWDNLAYGGHAKASLDILQGLDIGLTAYRGRNFLPTSTINYTGMTPTSVTIAYDRLTFVGADLVLAPGGGLILKTEWGYKTLRDSSLLVPESDAASLQGVSGLEFRLGQVQLIGEYVLDWAKGSVAEGDSLEHSLVAIASWDAGSRMSLKVAAIHEFLFNSGMVAPQLSLTLADGLQFNAGIFLFYGEADPTYSGAHATYGAWKDNSLGKLSLKYSF